MEIYNDEDITATIKEIDNNDDGSYEIRLLIDKKMINVSSTGFLTLMRELDNFIKLISMLKPF